MIITILAFLFVLGILVLAHEFGHFIVAKLLGIKVKEFSFGFGPKLIGFKLGETTYLISLIPLGGYVRPEGENPETIDESNPDPNAFLFRPWWMKFSVALAGPLMNLVLAFVISIIIGINGIKFPDYPAIIGEIKKGGIAEERGFKEGDRILSVSKDPDFKEGREFSTWRLFLAQWDSLSKNPSVYVRVKRGEEEIPILLSLPKDKDWISEIKHDYPTKIGHVEVGLPAYKSGLSAGDSIISINGIKMTKWKDVSDAIRSHPNQTLELSIFRKEHLLNIKVTPLEDEIQGIGKVGLIGVRPAESEHSIERLSLKEAVVNAVAVTLRLVGTVYSSLFRYIFKNPALFSKTAGGPILIAELAGQQAKKGFSELLILTAGLSVILMVMNLLPIPILDGAIVLFSLIEWIRRKRMSLRWQINLQRIGFAIILLLMVFVSLNDVMRWGARQQALKRDKLKMENKNP